MQQGKELDHSAIGACLCGEAQAILAVASATAEGIRLVAQAIQSPGGVEATQLRVAVQYVEQFGHLAQKNNTVILPANVADVAAMVTTAMRVFRTDQPQR